MDVGFAVILSRLFGIRIFRLLRIFRLFGILAVFLLLRSDHLRLVAMDHLIHVNDKGGRVECVVNHRQGIDYLDEPLVSQIRLMTSRAE